jgi:hypothetical protein
VDPEACSGERVSFGGRRGVVVGSRDSNGWLRVQLHGDARPRHARFKALSFAREGPGPFVSLSSGEGLDGGVDGGGVDGGGVDGGGVDGGGVDGGDGAGAWRRGRVAWVRSAAAGNVLCWWPARVAASEPWLGGSGLRVRLRRLAWTSNRAENADESDDEEEGEGEGAGDGDGEEASAAKAASDAGEASAAGAGRRVFQEGDHVQVRRPSL